MSPKDFFRKPIIYNLIYIIHKSEGQSLRRLVIEAAAATRRFLHPKTNQLVHHNQKWACEERNVANSRSRQAEIKKLKLMKLKKKEELKLFAIQSLIIMCVSGERV